MIFKISWRIFPGLGNSHGSMHSYFCVCVEWAVLCLFTEGPGPGCLAGGGRRGRELDVGLSSCLLIPQLGSTADPQACCPHLWCLCAGTCWKVFILIIWSLYWFFKIIYLFTSLCWVLVAMLRICSLCCGMWDLVPWPGIEPRPPALGAWSLSHWTTMEAPELVPLNCGSPNSGSGIAPRYGPGGCCEKSLGASVDCPT